MTVRKSPRNDQMVLPVPTADNQLQTMSFGYVNAKAGVPGAGGKGAAVMRGALATKVINQLVHSTDWGSLDYLVCLFCVSSVQCARHD